MRTDGTHSEGRPLLDTEYRSHRPRSLVSPPGGGGGGGITHEVPFHVPPCCRHCSSAHGPDVWLPGTLGQRSVGGGGGGVSRHEGNLCENVGNLSHIELALVLAAVKLAEKVRIKAAKTRRTATGKNDAPAFFIDK